MMIITFWGGVILSFLFLLEGMDEKKKIITFWGGVILSFLFLLEGMEYEQNFWDFNLKYPLIFLTLTLLPPTLLSFNQKIFLKNSGKRVVVFICFLLLSLVFWVESFWLFFLFFEISVIPIILIITESGRSKNRLEARKFLFFFTRGSSLIFLIFLIWSIIQGWEMRRWNSFTVIEFNNSLEVFLSLLAILTFFVKIPSLFLHMWLPKAHVEAPVFGSIVLASVILKMGGYGIILFSPLIDFFFSSIISSFFFILFSFYSAFLCYGQKDLKVLIAYSRVNHMALVLIATIVGWSGGILGAILLMLGHGVVSSVLFFLRRSTYNLTSRRSLLILSRSGKDYLVLCIWIFFAFINIGFPPFVNFLGEIYILKIMAYRPYFFLVRIINFFVVGLYGILIVSSIAQRKSQKFSLKRGVRGLREYLILSIVLGHLFCFFILNFFKGGVFYV